MRPTRSLPAYGNQRSSGRSHSQDQRGQRHHYLYLDKYGRFPFEALPRNYKAAVAKLGKWKLEANGLLPWQVGVYSQKLTEAMKAGHWEEVKVDAAMHLALYVGKLTTRFIPPDNFDGKLRGSWASMNALTLVDAFFVFPDAPDDAAYHKPTDHAFGCLAQLDRERVACRPQCSHRTGVLHRRISDRFYSLGSHHGVRQLSNAATDTSSAAAGSTAAPNNCRTEFVLRRLQFLGVISKGHSFDRAPHSHRFPAQGRAACAS